METKLKERREAFNRATSEFNRVKRAKLSVSASESGSHDSEKDRERANRASAAASRAKVVYYSRELEVRTDRLETERNHYMRLHRDTAERLEKLSRKNRQLKKALRDLWELKDAKICAYLVDSNALFLLSNEEAQERSRQEEQVSVSRQEETFQYLRLPQEDVQRQEYQVHQYHQAPSFRKTSAPPGEQLGPTRRSSSTGDSPGSSPAADNPGSQPPTVRRSSCSEYSLPSVPSIPALPPLARSAPFHPMYHPPHPSYQYNCNYHHGSSPVSQETSDHLPPPPASQPLPPARR